MAKHNKLGQAGEEYAAGYLERQGYHIRHRNWRDGHKELDIVATQQELLVIVEVKTRKNTDYGNPEEAVTERKIRNIISSADAYIKKFCLDLPVRFDIITVVGSEGHFTVEHIEDAFVPPLW